MPRMTFINLPVKDLAKSTAFFRELGFSFDPTFTDDSATRMIVSDEASVMLYMRGFRDLDGHQWSFIHMDMSAVPQA